MLLLVALLSACREDDAGTPQAQMRTISLNFPAIQPYTASRADDVNAVTNESTFHTADIWVFDSNTDDNATAAAYKHIEDAERYTTAGGELRIELTIPEEINTVDIYVITNSSAQGLSATSTRSVLQDATFDSTPESNQDPELASNGLLMSRIITGIPVKDLSGGYDSNTTLPLERGVAKIACFFAKESESMRAEITGITVSGATDMGSVFPEAVTYANKNTRPSAANVPEGATNTGSIRIAPPTTISVLPEGETLARGDEDAQAYVTRLSQIASSTNDYYLYEAEISVTISYTINGEPQEPVSVPLNENENGIDVIRNHYVVITGYIPDQLQPMETDLNILVIPWGIKGNEEGIIEVPPFI